MVVTLAVVVPVPPAVSAMLDGLTLQVGGLCARLGDEVSVQVRFIVPEKVVPAESATAEVAIAPGETATGVCAVAMTWETVTLAVPVDAA